jgi:hypothetical protein
VPVAALLTGGKPWVEMPRNFLASLVSKPKNKFWSELFTQLKIYDFYLARILITKSSLENLTVSDAVKACLPVCKVRPFLHASD